MIGPTDAGIGYGDYQSSTSSGIKSSIAFEFDTYMDPAPVSDLDSNHISAHYRPGGVANSAFESYSIIYKTGFPDMNDGKRHTVVVRG